MDRSEIQPGHRTGPTAELLLPPVQGTIAAVACRAVLVSADITTELLDEMFRFDDRLTSVILTTRAGPVLVPRSWFELSMTGRLGYGRLLFARSRVRDLPVPSTLTFPPDAPISFVAAEVVRRRDAAGVVEAVVVAGHSGFEVAAVSAVFEQLAVDYGHQSRHDPLTGLGNRLLLMRRLATLGLTGGQGVLLYVDLDRFKDVNDALGHPAGDQVLVQFAQRLREVCRADDLPVRLGGDEFALLVSQTLPAAGSLALAERLILAASAPYVVTATDAFGASNDHVVTIGASVGVAHSDRAVADLHLDGAEILLRQADLALYRAKSRGRGRAEHFDTALLPSRLDAQATRSERDMERRLRAAIDSCSLSLHYQPLVELPSGAVIGLEALARWEDPVLGRVGPDQFIPLAERTGLIVALGRWVLEVACQQAAAWVGSGGVPAPSISVNVSPVQLSEPGFVEEVAGVLQRSGLAGHRLCLEITETAAIDDVPDTAARLRRLAALGVRIALDDFGTGHSSLTLLRTLPVHVVKIDRSFVANIMTRASDAVLVRLVVETAHSLGMQVCAEGIEDLAQARQLVALGCDSAQGWLFGMPEPPSPRLTALLLDPGARVRGLDLGRGQGAVSGNDELVMVSTADRTITYVSGTAIHMLGWQPAELVGTNVVDHLHPDDLARHRAGEHLVGLFSAGSATHRAVHRDGSIRWLHSTSHQLDDDAHGVSVLSISRDVTRSVEAQLRAEVSQLRFQTAFERAPIGMTLTGLDGALLMVNDAFAELLGYTSAELVGRRVRDVTHADDWVDDASNFDQLLTGARTAHRVDKRYLHRDGHEVPVQVHAELVGNPAQPDAYLIVHVLPR